MANDLMNLGALLAASGGSGGIANSPVFGIKGKKQKRMDPMQILGMLDKFMGGAVKGYDDGGAVDDPAIDPTVTPDDQSIKDAKAKALVAALSAAPGVLLIVNSPFLF